MKHLILLKDKSVLVKTNVQKIIKTRYSEIEYILFDLKESNKTFLLHKIRKYMLNFKKAIITTQMIVIRESMDFENPKYTDMESLHLVISSLDNFISYMHSLNKMRYTNKLANSNETSDFDIICFKYFSIEIFDNKTQIYQCEMVGILPPSEILKSVKKIFNPIEINDMYITITNKNWFLSKSIDDSIPIYGVFYPYTKSYEFFHNDIFEKLSIVKSVYCASVVYNKHNINMDDVDTNEMFQCNMISGSLRFHDIWYSELAYYLEYISYINTIQTNLMISSEIAEFANINEKMTIRMKMEIEVMLDDGLHVIEHVIKSPDIITISDFINILNNYI